MVIKINRNKLLLFLVITVAGIWTFCGAAHRLKAETTATFPLENRVIVIDAGHGGIDGGAAGGGSLEKNINLSIAKYLKSYLKQSGAEVIMTRESDTTLAENEGTTKEKKRADLRERKNIVNNAAPDIFISIHQNFFGESKYKGAQTFYETNNINSAKLAKIVQESIINNIDKTNTRQPMEIPKSKILFRDLKVPAILVECGFLSNKEEAAMLKTKEYQQKMAYAIYIGISQYFCQ